SNIKTAKICNPVQIETFDAIKSNTLTRDTFFTNTSKIRKIAMDEDKKPSLIAEINNYISLDIEIQ
ncbi:hypothetical protein A3Q56_08719, partial [Intoshia linei]